MEIIEISYANRTGHVVFKVDNNLTIGGARDYARRAIVSKFGEGPEVVIDAADPMDSKKWMVSFHTLPKSYPIESYLEALLSDGFFLVHGMQAAWDMGGTWEFGDEAAGIRCEQDWENSAKATMQTIPVGIEREGLDFIMPDGSKLFEWAGHPGEFVEAVHQHIYKIYNTGV